MLRVHAYHIKNQAHMDYGTFYMPTTRQGYTASKEEAAYGDTDSHTPRTSHTGQTCRCFPYQRLDCQSSACRGSGRARKWRAWLERARAALAHGHAGVSAET